MEDNPFSILINNIRNDNKSQLPATFRFGKVTSINPLIIDVAGIQQEENELLKNSQLTSFYTGDLLLLLPIEEEQRYIIICKVVDA